MLSAVRPYVKNVGSKLNIYSTYIISTTEAAEPEQTGRQQRNLDLTEFTFIVSANKTKKPDVIKTFVI